MTAFETTVTKMKPQSIKLLAEGKVGARLVTFENGVEAIMKVAATSTMKNHRAMQRGLKTKTMPMREVAFYNLAKVFGFEDVVPETVLGSFHDYPASFQQYVTSSKLYDVEPRLRQPGDKEGWSVALRETLRDVVPFGDTLRLTVLDFLAAARDRHGANYGTRLDVTSGKARWRLVGWDNGCGFGLTQESYHCVAHKFLFRYAFDMSSVWDALSKVTRSELVKALSGLIPPLAIDHVWMRLQFVIAFPHRMPWVTLSGGSDDPDGFPSYAAFFKPLVGQQPLYLLQTQA